MPGCERSVFLYAKNGQVGFAVNSDLIVNAVQRDSMAENKVFIGNKILRVNNQVILTKAQFEKTIQEHTGQGMTIYVWHDKDKVEKPKPLDISKPGFETKDFCIVWNPISHQKLGLAVKGDGPNVFITTVAENSVCSMYLQEGDRILMIDGWPVTDKGNTIIQHSVIQVIFEMCRTSLVNAFRCNNRVTLKIERPINEETKSVVSACMTASTNQDPSVVMQSDVLDIMNRQLKKLEQNEDQKIKCVYKERSGDSTDSSKKKTKDENEPQQSKHVQIGGNVKEHVVGRDTSAMVGLLRSVPQKQPQPPGPQQ